MVVFPNAKINIGLHITEKRADGFHNIETVFYPIALCDVLEFVEFNSSDADEIQFANTGLAIENCSPEQNLCIKAYRLLLKDFELKPINVHLHKIIPFGAGMGGGSADAAFMITGMNKFFQLNLSVEQMKNYAAKLGSDCSFFIENKPAYAVEKGDKLTSIELSLMDYFIAVICPEIHVSTAEAYSNVRPAMAESSLSEQIKKPVTEWKNFIVNDFEKSVFPKYPAIKQIKEKLYGLGAVYASMSGSGSSVYGIFNKAILLENYFPDSFVWTGRIEI